MIHKIENTLEHKVITPTKWDPVDSSANATDIFHGKYLVLNNPTL